MSRRDRRCGDRRPQRGLRDPPGGGRDLPDRRRRGGPGAVGPRTRPPPPALRAAVPPGLPRAGARGVPRHRRGRGHRAETSRRAIPAGPPSTRSRVDPADGRYTEPPVRRSSDSPRVSGLCCRAGIRSLAPARPVLEVRITHGRPQEEDLQGEEPEPPGQRLEARGARRAASAPAAAPPSSPTWSAGAAAGTAAARPSTSIELMLAPGVASLRRPPRLPATGRAGRLRRLGPS